MADADPAGERVVVFEDVTELIRSQKLAAWSEMARQVAHEIKNPLTPIKLSAQMMERAWRDRREDFDGILTESLASISEQVEILRRIAQEFSQFGRRAELNLESVDLAGLLAELLAPYRDALAVDWRGPRELAVRADREALRKVLLNLVENAREAMEGAGRLVVRSPRSRGAAKAARWNSPCAITARASPRKRWAVSSSPTSARRRAARAWGSPSARNSWRRWAAACAWRTTRPGRGGAAQPAAG